ncbi:putative A-kinase anchor protein 9-like [Apostichopus japonicus]|uniref:Putative A-kinase anchor protein 9-like n=1 Tax=Stichopus japonicus TaxID=307972 RepID=A0A2G8KPR9_STIJA|nr:putative A-kinase anchor protein 9-like [Apostichopus japonicus]
MDSGNRSTANQEDEQILTSEIQSLKEELEETKDVISKEQNLFKEALEGEMSSSKDGRRENAGDEVQRLNELLDQKEQREKEILTEKNLQISVLQEASSRLADENEELLQELQDIKSRFVNSPDVSSSGFDGALDEEDLAGNGVDLAGRLDESVAREEMLRKRRIYSWKR